LGRGIPLNFCSDDTGPGGGTTFDEIRGGDRKKNERQG